MLAIRHLLVMDAPPAAVYEAVTTQRGPASWWTRPRFTHGGWRAETDFLASCDYHWGHHMRSLKQYCEVGRGEPLS
jgi:uncharacterized protein YndB with AHSA1/START domain